MDTHSLHLLSSPFLHTHRPSHKFTSQNPISQFPSPISFNSKPLTIFNGIQFPINKTPFPNPTNPPNPKLQNPPFHQFHQFSKSHLPLALSHLLLAPLPALAVETGSSDKINLESILLSIDDFFNRYPFFVAGCTFVWLVGIPLIDYFFFRKYKFISAIDAFCRIRDDPNAQLLDVRDEKNLAIMGSPNLRILNKDVVQVVYNGEDEDGFVKKVKERFGDNADAIVFVLDK